MIQRSVSICSHGGLQVHTDNIQTTDQGALMHVLATTVEALVVVCGRGPASEAAALEHITAVDPPSAKVQLKEVCSFDGRSWEQ